MLESVSLVVVNELSVKVVPTSVSELKIGNIVGQLFVFKTGLSLGRILEIVRNIVHFTEVYKNTYQHSSLRHLAYRKPVHTRYIRLYDYLYFISVQMCVLDDPASYINKVYGVPVRCRGHTARSNLSHPTGFHLRA